MAVRAVRDFARRVVDERGYYVAHADREDLLQQTLLDVYRAASRPGFALRAGLHAFVRSITHRRCIDWVRLRRPVEPISAEMPDPGNPVDLKLEESQRIAIAAQALRRLGAECRELIVLRAGRGLSYGQIAAARGERAGTVRNRMHRCLRRAHRLFREMESRREAGSR